MKLNNTAENGDNLTNQKETTCRTFSREHELIVPDFSEKIVKKFVFRGDDNLYPNFLLSLADNNAKHRAIIEAKTDMVAGEGFESSNDAILNEFLSNRRGEEEVTEVIKKAAFDLNLYGYCFLTVVWNRTRDKIAAIHYLDALKVVYMNKETEEDAQMLAVAADWRRIKNDKIKYYPEFKDERNLPEERKRNININTTQLLCIKQFAAGCDYYSKPVYAGAIKSILTDNTIKEYYANHAENGYSQDIAVTLFGSPNQDEREEILDDFERNFKGTKGSKAFVAFAESQEVAPKYDVLSSNNNDKKFIEIQKILESDILTGHRVTSPMLFGIKESGQLGGNQELDKSFAIFQKTVISPKQKLFEHHLSNLAAINGAAEKVVIKKYSII